MMLLKCLLLGAALHITWAINDNKILSLYSQQFTGEGTYYGTGNGGLCQFDVPSMPPVASHVDKLVALNSRQMFGSSGCGMCFRVNGTGVGLGADPITGSFVVYVKDICPECLAGDLDLAEDGDGRWDIHMQAVQCPVGGTKISYAFQNANPWYLKLQVRNERMPATTVEMLQPTSNVWIELFRTLDGFWEFPSDSRIEKPIQLPIRLRLHAPNGEVVEDTVHASKMEYGGLIYGDGVQFKKDHSLPYACMKTPPQN